jgi:hypothetical protein
VPIVAHPAQRRRQLLVTLRHPPQRAHRITHRRRLYQLAQIVHHSRVFGCYHGPTGTFPTHLADQRTWLPQVLEAAPDRAADNLCRSRRGSDTTASSGDGFRRRLKPPTPLIERRPDGLIAGTDGVLIDHGPTICRVRRVGNPARTPQRELIRLFLSVALMQKEEVTGGDCRCPGERGDAAFRAVTPCGAVVQLSIGGVIGEALAAAGEIPGRARDKD